MDQPSVSAEVVVRAVAGSVVGAAGTMLVVMEVATALSGRLVMAPLETWARGPSVKGGVWEGGV